ncbi:EVE domain-containing protein [Pseudomonas parakoreensis]
MAYWLMKSEPDELSIKGLETLGKARWDGVRNYQARNFLRAMAVGDEFFSTTPVARNRGLPESAGLFRQRTRIPPHWTRKPLLRPESHARENAWSAIDVAHVETFARVLKLDYLKQQTALAEMPLVQKAAVFRSCR